VERGCDIQWPGIAVEGVAIVVSILLAFAIDAAWEQRQEHHEERRILNSLYAELLSNQVSLVEKTKWQGDVQSATRDLLVEAARPQRTLTDDAIDDLLAMASWYNNSSTFEMSAVDAVVHGGGLSLIENETLRKWITGWSREVVRVTQAERQDYDVFKDVWMQFLRTHSYLPQIHNSVDVQPGTGQEDYIPDIPLGPHSMSHAELLAHREFQNVLLQRLWVHGDIIYEYGELEPKLSSLIGLLSAELER